MTNRKKDHLEMAKKSQMRGIDPAKNLDYAPLFMVHPQRVSGQFLDQEEFAGHVAGKKLLFPLWISSMTGGAESALQINSHLARLAESAGLGFGLGSCRNLLMENPRNHQTWNDFDMKPILQKSPLGANIGIAQIAELIKSKKIFLLEQMIEELQADLLFIHLNPIQEILQPEGDYFAESSLGILENFLFLKSQSKLFKNIPIFVKEVGQGMSKNCLRSLLKIDIQGIEFGAFGGTNFASIELARRGVSENSPLWALAQIGHSAREMVHYLEELVSLENLQINKTIIISGGRGDPLEDFELWSRVKKMQENVFIGLGSKLLEKAIEGQVSLKNYFLEYREAFYILHSCLKSN